MYWTLLKQRFFFPFYRQLDDKDCGPTCIRMIARYYGRKFHPDYLVDISQLTAQGASLQNIDKAAQQLGFLTINGTTTSRQLTDSIPLPCILHWASTHFVVLYKINAKKGTYYLADPARGKRIVSKNTLEQHWLHNNEDKGYLLLLSPSETFYTHPAGNT